MRYFMHLCYDGRGYHGWQAQPGDVATVQGVIEGALATILRREVPIVAAGRTDTGVNALNMVAHLNLEPREVEEGLIQRLDALLPRTIAVHSLEAVTAHANARYDATSRTYHYHILHRRDPFLGPLALYMPRQPDYDLMNRGAQYLIGHHDFTSLSRTHTQTHTNMCRVTEARWIVSDDNATFVISADRFLRGMVRAAVGTLLDVGRGKLPPEAVKDVLEARDRRVAGQAAPPEALYLAAIEYPYYHRAATASNDPFGTF